MTDTTAAAPLLELRGVTAAADEKTILHGIDLAVTAGETHVLMGPNGAGKSTMGHVIMGDPTYTVQSGSISFDGRDITELTPDKRSRAGLFLSFQAPVEIPGVPLSSFLRAEIAGRPGLEMKGKEFRRRVKELAGQLDMDTACTLVIITHNTRILEHLHVDRVHVMVAGRIVKEGGADLIPWIDEHGFESFEQVAGHGAAADPQAVAASQGE